MLRIRAGSALSDTDTRHRYKCAHDHFRRDALQNEHTGYYEGSSGRPRDNGRIIVYNNYNILGSIDKNTEAGIYGTLDKIDDLLRSRIPIETAAADEIVTGDAQIRCYIDNELKNYDIRVTDIDMSEKRSTRE